MYNFLNQKRVDYIYILILSLPVFAVLSIFFLELALLIISSSFLINCLKKKNFHYFNNFFFKFSIVFYIYLLINFLIQSENINTLSVIFYFRYPLYVVSIYFFLDNKNNLFSDFLKVVSFLIILLGIDTIFQSIFKYNLIGLEIIESFRASSFFGDELILGSFIFRLLPFVFLLSIMKKKIFNDFTNSILITLSFLIIFLSGERTSMLLSVFLLIIYFFFLKKEKIIEYLKIYFLVLVIAISVILLFSKNYQYRYIAEPLNDFSNNYKVTKDLLEGYDHEPKVIFFSGLHHNLMITSFRIFNDSKIFGSGPRSFRDVCNDYKINRFSCDRHPHNFYFQLLAETGIVGFSFLIFIYALVIKEIYKISKEKKPKFRLRLCLIGFYIAALWPIMPSGNFFNNWLSIMIYLPFPFYLYLSKKLSE